MNHDEQMAIAISLALSPVLFVLFAVLAYMQRGYYACGGEFVALLLPYYVFCILCIRRGGNA